MHPRRIFLGGEIEKKKEKKIGDHPTPPKLEDPPKNWRPHPPEKLETTPPPGTRPPHPVDRHTLVKILPWPNFVAAGKNAIFFHNEVVYGIYGSQSSSCVVAVFEKRCSERYDYNGINAHGAAGGTRVDEPNVNSMDECETFCVEVIQQKNINMIQELHSKSVFAISILFWDISCFHLIRTCLFYKSIFDLMTFIHLKDYNEYRSGTDNSNTVNSKFHLIQSFFEIFARFLSFYV